ncbi:MAG: hypothetical protein KJ017_12095 [Alphaproteobacteria bacterium]|nr:hypothetical protein [Alphaproteobacteria bacterium]
MIDVLALLLDMLIVALLGATIFFAMRLYSSLSSFREHRDDFEHVVAKLISSIGQAEQAMKNLKNTGTQEAQNLEELIRHAREMTEELRMVNEASGNMANRLEELAEKNRKIVEGFDARTPYKAPRVSRPHEDDEDDEPLVPVSAAPSPVATKPSAVAVKVPAPANTSHAKPAAKQTAPKESAPDASFPSFFIRDREYDEASALEPALDSRRGFVDVFEEDEDEEESPIPAALQSQAERELYAALQKNKRKAANGGQG